jgi:hypothetical protein
MRVACVRVACMRVTRMRPCAVRSACEWRVRARRMCDEFEFGMRGARRAASCAVTRRVGRRGKLPAAQAARCATWCVPRLSAPTSHSLSPQQRAAALRTSMQPRPTDRTRGPRPRAPPATNGSLSGPRQIDRRRELHHHRTAALLTLCVRSSVRAATLTPASVCSVSCWCA